MRLTEIRAIMCDEGWPHVKGKKTQPNPLACAECESICLGGVELLKKIPDAEFRALLCGGDCETCRQPCNLRRLAFMRKIKPIVVRHKPSTWIDIAMWPYNQRHAFEER
jgi:hypothetical protein